MQIPRQIPTGGSQLVDVEALTRALCAPFEAGEVKFKPAVVSGNRAMALAYVDARVIQDRLDEVLGVMGWQDSYKVLPDGSVMCRLRIRLGDQWITKVDVGGQSEQPDGGDRTKAAFSDALKRAAVKFGVGRYLYRLPSLWVEYDPQKRRFAREPQLPASALPPRSAPSPRSTPPPSRPASASSPTNGSPPPRSTPPKIASHTAPMTGPDLQRRLQDYDARLAGEGLCKVGDLVNHVLQAGLKAGFGNDMATWTGPAIQLAIAETKGFQNSRRATPKESAA